MLLDHVRSQILEVREARVASNAVAMRVVLLWASGFERHFHPIEMTLRFVLKIPSDPHLRFDDTFSSFDDAI